MPAISHSPIKAIGKGGLKPLHTDRQIGVRCLQAEMVVIVEQTEGMKNPPRSFTGGLQHLYKDPFTALRSKHVAPIVPAIQYMVNRTRIFNT